MGPPLTPTPLPASGERGASSPLAESAQSAYTSSFPGEPAARAAGETFEVNGDFRGTLRHFALPEVFLGLFPAWGGTQLLPRLVGPETAVKVIVSNPLRQNRMLTGAQVAELGIADRLLEPVEFVDESLAFARELAERPPDRIEPDWSEAETIFRRARTAVDDQVHGAAPAPYTALELIEGVREWTLEDGCRREEDAIAELLPSPQAQASIYAFRLVEQRAKKRPGRPAASPRKIERVGIVGAGLMARQIATLFLRRLEVPIVLRDVKQEIVDEAIDDIRGEIAAQVAKGRYDEGKGRFLGSLVSGGTEYEQFAGCGLVLEAVFEELDVKKDVFTRLDDAPGFVVNRVLTRMTRVIMDAIEHGTPTEDVDEAVMSLGMPMAPSVLLAMVGPRVANHVLETMHESFPDRFPLSPTLANYAAGNDEVVIVDQDPWTRAEIVERVLEAVADEIHRLLDEGVVPEAADVDTCLLLGAGWPFFLGGITKHLDQTGVSERMFGETFGDIRAAATA